MPAQLSHPNLTDHEVHKKFHDTATRRHADGIFFTQPPPDGGKSVHRDLAQRVSSSKSS